MLSEADDEKVVIMSLNYLTVNRKVNRNLENCSSDKRPTRLLHDNTAGAGTGGRRAPN